MKWLSLPLQDIAPAQTSDIRFSPNEQVWHLTLDQIESHTGNIVNKKYAPASEAGTSTYIFNDSNVLYSKLRPYLNKVLCPMEPGIATSELIPLRPQKDLVDRQYLTYYLRSNHFLGFANVAVAGVKMPRIIMAKFWKHHVPLPPLSEQHRIIDILNQADSLRKMRIEADAKASRILPALFHKLFGDSATNQKGWPTGKIGDLFEVDGGGTPSKSIPEYWTGNIPWVSPKDMKRAVVLDTADHITQEAIRNSATRVVKEGSVLIVYRSGILVHSFPVAFAGRNLTINQDLKALSSKGEVTNEYLYGLLSAVPAVGLSCVKKGATVHNVDGARFLSLKICKPPEKLQKVFASQLHALLRNKTEQQAASEKAEKIFAVLLHRAFIGDLTARWREAHMKELLQEMEQQAKALDC
jgi:type I restriction enzyme S subunit